MRKVRVFPYKQGSASAKALAEVLDGKVLKLKGSKYVARPGDVVINWGAGGFTGFVNATVLNREVGDAANKLTAFKRMSKAGVRVPPWSEEKPGPNTDHKWEFPIVCRTKLTGHSGQGIVMAATFDEVVRAPLYTKYVKKQDEYRVHVLKENAFYIQRKARKLDNEQPNWQVRNLAGGFVFVESPENETPRDVLTQSLAAIKALGLDFGGVDVMWNAKEQKAYVLEVNTACGLEERTAQKYRDAFVPLIAD